MLKRLFLSFAALAMGGMLAVADDAHDHDHEHKAMHNGIVAHSGHHDLELVATGSSIALYVSHDGKPEDISAAKASATVLSGGKTETVALAPGDGKLEGTGTFTAGAGTVVVVTLTLPEHEPEQVRFKLD